MTNGRILSIWETALTRKSAASIATTFQRMAMYSLPDSSSRREVLLGASIDLAAISVVLSTLLALVGAMKLEGVSSDQNARNLNKFAYSYKRRYVIR